MEGLYKNLVKYLADQRRETFPELTGDNGEYIINNDYLNYFIIFMKSFRYNDDSGVEINYERLADEMKLFKYYSEGPQNKKKLHMFAVMSIAYSNEKTEDIDRELARYCDFFDIKTNGLPELLYFSYLIWASQTYRDKDAVYDEAKSKFIMFSYKSSFGMDSKADIISFEKKRIELLSKVIVGDYEGYPILLAFKSIIGNGGNRGICENEKVDLFVKDLLDYLIKIRKGRIRTMSYNPVEGKLYNEHENSVIDHGNFGKCRVIKNIKNKEGKTIIVNTRLGCYRLEN